MLNLPKSAKRQVNGNSCDTVSQELKATQDNGLSKLSPVFACSFLVFAFGLGVLKLNSYQLILGLLK